MTAHDVEIHLFAAARAAVGASIVAAVPGSLGAILDGLALEHPAFADVQREARDVDELLDGHLEPDDRDYLVVVTRDHARDERALAELLRRPHRYLGMIGSRRKVVAVLRRILHRERESGRPTPDLSRVRAPIGLALGGRTPVEIAISIVAELVADRHGGTGAAMNMIGSVIDRSAETPDAPDDAGAP